MEWLKKHWELIAFSGVGILVLYWLYKTYQANQAANAQAAQDATANADAAATANQLQVAYGGYYSGSGSGGGGGSTIAPPAGVAGQSQPIAISPSSQPSDSPTTGGGYLSVADAIASLPVAEQNGDYSYSQNSAVPNNPNPIYAPGSPQAIALGYSSDPASTPSAVSTLLGSGGGNNDTAPVAVQATQPDVPISHIADGTIPIHDTIPKTPTTVEMSSLGGRF